MANSLIYCNDPITAIDGKEFIGVIGEIGGSSNYASHVHISDYVIPMSNVSNIIEGVTIDNLPIGVLDLRV